MLQIHELQLLNCVADSVFKFILHTAFK